MSVSVTRELKKLWGRDYHGPRPLPSSLSSEALHAVSVAHSELGTDVEWAKTLSKKIVGEWNERTEELILMQMQGKDMAEDDTIEEVDDQRTPAPGTTSHREEAVEENMTEDEGADRDDGQAAEVGAMVPTIL